MQTWSGYEAQGDPEFETQVITDENGAYELALETPRVTTVVRVHVVDEKNHCSSPAQDLVAVGRQPQELEVSAFPHDATLVGHVRGVAGHPIAAAKLFAGGASAETDEQGFFRLPVSSVSAVLRAYVLAEGFGESVSVVNSLAPANNVNPNSWFCPNFVSRERSSIPTESR